MSSIYLIHFGNLEKVYVGSSKCVTTRKSIHLDRLRKKKHHSITLQNAFNKYGEENFHMEIFEDDIPNEDLLAWEQACFEYFSCATKDIPYYNIAKFANSPAGTKRSAEWKINRSEKIRGVNHPFYGKKHSIESKTKMSIAKKGVLCGKSPSKQTRDRLSEANKGKHTGEKSGKSRFSDAQRQEIKRLYASGLFSQRTLGKMFGMSHNNIGHIIRNFDSN